MNENVFNPQYSPYVPLHQIQDIENQHFKNIQNKINDLQLQLNKSNEMHNAEIKLLQKNFNENIKIRFIDGILGIVLFVILYVKVFTNLPV